MSQVHHLREERHTSQNDHAVRRTDQPWREPALWILLGLVLGVAILAALVRLTEPKEARFVSHEDPGITQVIEHGFDGLSQPATDPSSYRY